MVGKVCCIPGQKEKRSTLNKRLLVASLLAAFTASIHFFWGGKDVATPLLASTLSAEPRLTLYAVWHMASFALALSAIALFIGSRPKHEHASKYLVRFISVLWLGFAVVFLAIAIAQPDQGWLLKLPQWTLLAPVGILGLWKNKRIDEN
jgi:glucan phosphoethanolaminetransferase (alkaline phosphatase superfamily)